MPLESQLRRMHHTTIAREDLGVHHTRQRLTLCTHISWTAGTQLPTSPLKCVTQGEGRCQKHRVRGHHYQEDETQIQHTEDSHFMNFVIWPSPDRWSSFGHFSLLITLAIYVLTFFFVTSPAHIPCSFIIGSTCFFLPALFISFLQLHFYVWLTFLAFTQFFTLILSPFVLFFVF